MLVAWNCPSEHLFSAPSCTSRPIPPTAPGRPIGLEDGELVKSTKTAPSRQQGALGAKRGERGRQDPSGRRVTRKVPNCRGDQTSWRTISCLEGAQQQSERRTTGRAPCLCSAGIVGVLTRIGDAWAVGTHKETKASSITNRCRVRLN